MFPEASGRDRDAVKGAFHLCGLWVWVRDIAEQAPCCTYFGAPQAAPQDRGKTRDVGKADTLQAILLHVPLEDWYGIIPGWGGPPKEEMAVPSEVLVWDPTDGCEVC